MRIALFTDTCPPTLNGVARALGLLIDHAEAAGHEVALVGPRLEGEPHPGTRLHIRLPGVALPFYKELQAVRPWLGSAHAAALHDFRPDIAHIATEALAGMVGRAWALREGVPLVTSYCTNFPDYLPGYGLGFAQGWCWRYLRTFHEAARITFCPSEATRSDLRRRGFHDRMRIWSRGVDAELFDPAKRSEALRREIAPDADVILAYVGRIAPEKKIDLLVEALPRIRDQASVSVALLMVGGGPALERLRSLRMDGVHFAGYRTGEDLAAHYASADLFVFPSDTETFGQVVTEALASGLPAIAPSRGGVTDTVVPGLTGALFEPGDVDGLVAATLPLVEDAALRGRLSRNGRARAKTRSWAKVFSRLFEDYAEAASARYGAVTASTAESAGGESTLEKE